MREGKILKKHCGEGRAGMEPGRGAKSLGIDAKAGRCRGGAGKEEIKQLGAGEKGKKSKPPIEDHPKGSELDRLNIIVSDRKAGKGDDRRNQ